MIAVADASVVLKWFLQEPDSAHAVLLRERHLTGDILLAAPDLLLYEVATPCASSATSPRPASKRR